MCIFIVVEAALNIPSSRLDDVRSPLVATGSNGTTTAHMSRKARVLHVRDLASLIIRGAGANPRDASKISTEDTQTSIARSSPS